VLERLAFFSGGIFVGIILTPHLFQNVLLRFRYNLWLDRNYDNLHTHGHDERFRLYGECFARKTKRAFGLTVGKP
jgi:hypothetical protein